MYVADYKYKDGDNTVVVDVKSPIREREQNSVYQIKRKLFMYRYRDVIFREMV